MKTFKEFINERLDIPSNISIEEFIKQLEIPIKNRKTVIEWWKKNRNNIEIYYFPFKIDRVVGCLIGENQVAINSISLHKRDENLLKLFVLLHESFHSDQHQHLIDKDSYFNSVKNNKIEEFLPIYKKIETDANTYAIKGMKEMGFELFIKNWGHYLRGNEEIGKQVWNDIQQDFKKYKPTDVFDLIKKQIFNEII